MLDIHKLKILGETAGEERGHRLDTLSNFQICCSKFPTDTVSRYGWHLTWFTLEVVGVFTSNRSVELVKLEHKYVAIWCDSQRPHHGHLHIPTKYLRRCSNTQFCFTLFFISQDDDDDNDDYVTGTVVGCTRNLVWIGFGVTWVLVHASGLLESLEEVEVDERTELLPDEGSGESNVNPRLRISRTLSTSLRYVLRFWTAKFRRWAVRNSHSNR